MEKHYAQALESLLAKGGDTKKIVAQLMIHLKTSGRMKLLPGILRELKVLEARKAKLAPQVEVASEKESHAALSAAKKLGVEVAKAQVNHDLLKGWRARSGATLIDRSAKQGLIDLYRTITN